MCASLALINAGTSAVRVRRTRACRGAPAWPPAEAEPAEAAAVLPHALVVVAAEVPRARVAAAAQRAPAREAGAVAGRRSPAAEMGASPRVQAALVHVRARHSPAAAVAHGFAVPAALAGSRLAARAAAPELPSAAHAQKAMLRSAARLAAARVVDPHQRAGREARLRWECPPAREDGGSQRAPAGCGPRQASCSRACRDEPGGPLRLGLARPP